MRRICLLLVFAVVCIILSGCIGGFKSGSLTGQVFVTKGRHSDSLEGAVVSVAGKTATTGPSGTFDISDLSTGIQEVNVYSGESDPSCDKDVLLWSRKLNIGSGTNTVSIDVAPIVIVLRHIGGWQIAFYFSPPSDLEIVNPSYIETPSGNIKYMSPHFLPQWHVWWNMFSPEAGDYTAVVNYNDGTSNEYRVNISQDIFDNLNLPTLLSPADGATVSSTPTISYQYSGVATDAYVRIKDNISGEEKWISMGSSTVFQIPPGVLESGRTYLWAIQTVNHAGPIWTESKSEYYTFTVQ